MIIMYQHDQTKIWDQKWAVIKFLDMKLYSLCTCISTPCHQLQNHYVMKLHTFWKLPTSLYSYEWYSWVSSLADPRLSEINEMSQRARDLDLRHPFTWPPCLNSTYRHTHTQCQNYYTRYVRDVCKDTEVLQFYITRTWFWYQNFPESPMNNCVTHILVQKSEYIPRGIV